MDRAVRQESMGKGSYPAYNLVLCFAEVDTGKKYWFSVFSHNGFGPEDNGLNFPDVEPGAVLEHYRLVLSARSTPIVTRSCVRWSLLFASLTL